MASKPTYEELTAKIGDLEKQVEELREYERLWEKNATRLKETESALEDCLSRYQDLFENAPIGIFQTTSDGRANFINPYMARLVGGDQPSSTPPLFTDLSHQLYADPQRRAEFLQILEETGEVQGFEYEAVRLNGSRRWFSMNARISQRFSDGTFAIDGFTADITELKKMQNRLLKNERLLQESQRISKVGGWEYLIDKGRLYWTDEVYRIYGVSRQSYDPNDIEQDLSFYAPEDREALEQAFYRAVNEGVGYDMKLRLITATGHRTWVRTTAKAESEQGRIVRLIGNIMDITEEKEAEQRRLDLEKQLQQSQKMEAVGRLAGGVAHDFNNLLSIVLGYSEMVMETIPETHPHRDPLLQVHDAGVRARNLTRQLLAFSRKQVLEIQTVDANKVISGFEKLLQRIIGEDIRLHLKLSPEPIYFKADPSQIEQVLMNLTINARDAMPDGGSLAFETAAVNLDACYTDNKQGVSPGPHVMIAISDSGSGMDAKTRQHIFEPFFSTKDKDKGSGLGLATCYGIVRQHGGNIWVYSEPGQGTTFKIYLPYSTGQEPSADSADAGATAPINGSATILVVEDDPVVRKLACDVLRKSGFRVISAADVNQIIDKARQQQDPIHLILTDVIMPDMKGPEVYQQVAGYHPDVKVLYMSGYTDNVVAHHGILDEDVAFIQKPFSIKNLVAKVNQVLGQ